MTKGAQSIGYLFPAGGPVPRELMLGRQGSIAELSRRIEERMHTILTGRRRIGKTTVCNAVCERLESDGVPVVRIEVPESLDSGALMQAIVDRSRGRNRVREIGVEAFGVARPLLEKYLAEKGIPLDLSQFAAGPAPENVGVILELPRRVAEATRCSSSR